MGININKIASGQTYQKLAKGANKACEKVGSLVTESAHKDTFGKIIKNIDPTGGNNTFLGMAGLMVGLVIVPRVLTAAKRNPDDKEATKDEIKEILFRDVQTVLVVLFALKAMNSIVAGKASKLTGLPMTNKPYQKLFNSEEKGLNGIKAKAQEFAQQPVEKLKIMGKNILDTLNPTGGVRALTNDEFVAKFSGFKSVDEIKKVLDEIGEENGNPDKIFKKVMDILIKDQKATMQAEAAKGVAGFEANSAKAQEILKGLESLKEKGVSGLNEQIDGNIEKQLVSFFTNKDNRLVMDAKGLNAWLRTGALAFESLYLGFGIPALNQQRLKKKYLENGDASVQQQNNTQSQDKFVFTNKNVSEQEVKVFKQFIK